MHPSLRRHPLVILLALLLTHAALGAEAVPARIDVDFARALAPLDLDRMALGQGGTSEEPTWASRVTEVRALRPRVIRLFVQEYFDLLPAAGRPNFDTLDRSVDLIVRTGASPLMCLCFKPRLLFPEVNQDVVEPRDYTAWEDLIAALVRHYRDRGVAIRYWEVANEPDIGEDGGCPYRFQPDSYVRYYRHTAAAIRRADPAAKVGGPALASVRSPILPALLDAAARGEVPLDFISWHIYSSSPAAIRDTVNFARAELARRPGLTPETFLDEWNMDLMNPPLDPRFQPCFILESIHQMKEAGLDYSCYYHIRDYPVRLERFTPFMSPQGAAFMTRWWNRMPQFDGLFDYQDQVRPAYFAFKLLARLAGDRLGVASSAPTVHGFAGRDGTLLMDNVLLWNFSDRPVQATVRWQGLPGKRRVRHVVLDATAASSDENARLRPDPPATIAAGDQAFELTFAPYAIHYWSFE